MKIIILAAGIGSRLGNPLPKPLTVLQNGKSIMQMQIDNFTKHFNTDNIMVVVGFKKDLIMENFPELTYVYNAFFDTTNTSKSLLHALKKNKNQKVLWVNGDVVFDERVLSVLKPYIKKKQSFVVVNTAKVGEEEVKYTLENGYINQLSKSVKNALGEVLGINFISKKDIKTLIKWLEKCGDSDYFERGIELAIENDGLQIVPVDISQFKCVEIDFQEDLDNANNLFQTS